MFKKLFTEYYLRVKLSRLVKYPSFKVPLCSPKYEPFSNPWDKKWQTTKSCRFTSCKKVEFLISSVSYDKWEINEEEYFLLQWMINKSCVAHQVCFNKLNRTSSISNFHKEYLVKNGRKTKLLLKHLQKTFKHLILF